MIRGDEPFLRRLDGWARARDMPPYEAAMALLKNSKTNVSTVV